MPPQLPPPTSEQPLRRQLRVRLAGLPFPELLTCVQRLLTAAGYTDLQAVGRPAGRGKNARGGFDLTGQAPLGLCRTKVIVQVKQYAPGLLVQQKQIDELRGACLRAGAGQGILVTLSGFSRVVQKGMRTAAPLAPLWLLDGEELLSLLLAYQIGVTPAGDGRWVLDESPVRGWGGGGAAGSPAAPPEDGPSKMVSSTGPGAARPSRPAAPRLAVTVVVTPLAAPSPPKGGPS